MEVEWMSAFNLSEELHGCDFGDSEADIYELFVAHAQCNTTNLQ